VSHRIAVIDDERGICDLLRIMFDSRGWRTLAAHDGRAGIDLVRREQPAVVLSDLKMPGLNGFELIQELRRDPATAGIPIVLLSAITQDSGKSDEEWAKSAGADAYVTKPFSPEAVLQLVEGLLAKR
jgi:CheY-like chemotaxis protein